MEKKLTLKFDPNTIEHLGISLYSKLPSVISELVSNSWDADADKIEINFIDSNGVKTIHYKDDGHGMNFEELNDKYLMIGRNRRRDDNSQESPGGRKVIGKKGLGKLSVFGVCNEVEIRTVRNGVENRFVMHIDEIKKASNSHYSPRILALDRPVSESSGTEIWLREVKRKSPFKLDEIALSLSKKFLIFDRLHTKLLSNGKEVVVVTNELKFSGFNVEFSWDFPDHALSSDYEHKADVKGRLITLETPIKDPEMKGVYLSSRGKIVNIADFYGLRDTDQFHSYVTGYLEVDFIDELDVDLISTDRHSLNWEHDVTRDLQSHIQRIIKYVAQDWKKRRREKKAGEIEQQSGLSISAWEGKLPTHERALAERIIHPILENPAFDVTESSGIIRNVIGKFENSSFKAYASQIAETVDPEEMPKLLKLMDEWKMIEAKQISDLAISRIEVIKQFEEHLTKDTREVPTLHNFLKKFSWLLDPRILEFRDEVTYTTLLKESYPDEELAIADRRIDFLCSNALGGILYVIEIKRSKYKVDLKAIDQAYAYGAFLLDKYASASGFSKVVCYVVGGEKSSDSLFKRKEATYMQSGEVFVKTYRELLEQSKQYHREFIEAFKNLS